MSIKTGNLTGGSGRVPTSLYTVHVMEVSNKPSAAGNPMTTLSLEILSPETAAIGEQSYRTVGRKFKMYVTFGENNVPDAVAALTKLGAPVPAEFANVEEFIEWAQKWLVENAPGLTFEMLVSSSESIKYKDQTPEDRAARKPREPLLDGNGQPVKLGWEINMPRLSDIYGNAKQNGPY